MDESSPSHSIRCPGFQAAVDSGELDGTALADPLIEDAAAARATDVHIDPHREQYVVRLRIDGELYPVAALPRPAGEALARSIQVGADIDTATGADRLEGAAHFGPPGVSTRVAYAATVSGPKLTLRLLEASQVRHDVRELGMNQALETAMLQWAQHAEGMLLCIGPTGCGKTTTCYSLLNEMKERGRNLLTLEDPVEFVIDGINQIPLDPEDRTLPGTFAEGIRGALRHDPDTLFLGEIRDEPTAAAALDASFSGHVILSTMHARDPASAITLLRSMGARDYEIAASLKIVIGQRILRLLCESCRTERTPSEAEAAAASESGVELETLWSSEGCSNCAGTGYRGLTAVFESWPLEEEDYAAIMRREDEHALRDRLRDRGVKSLGNAAFEKVRDGETSLTEAAALR